MVAATSHPIPPKSAEGAFGNPSSRAATVPDSPDSGRWIAERTLAKRLPTYGLFDTHTHTFHLIWSHLVWSHLLSYHIICSTCFCWVMFWDCAFQAANCVSGNNPYFLQGFAMTRLPCWIITLVPAGSMLTSPGVYTVFYLWIYIQCYTHTYIYNMNIFTLYI